MGNFPLGSLLVVIVSGQHVAQVAVCVFWTFLFGFLSQAWPQSVKSSVPSSVAMMHGWDADSGWGHCIHVFPSAVQLMRVTMKNWLKPDLLRLKKNNQNWYFIYHPKSMPFFFLKEWSFFTTCLKISLTLRANSGMKIHLEEASGQEGSQSSSWAWPTR